MLHDFSSRWFAGQRRGTAPARRKTFTPRLDLLEDRLAPAVALGFASTFGSSGADDVTSTAIDSAGNVYLTGSFSGTVDFDSGPGTLSRTSAGQSDAYVAKVSPTGALLWVAQFGGSN